jgi:predicted nucleic acid-binding protein
VLVDAGPLVALLDQGDPDHEGTVKAFKTIREPLITVWPAFTEAMYILRGSWRAQKALWSRWRPMPCTWRPWTSGTRLACAS